MTAYDYHLLANGQGTQVDSEHHAELKLRVQFPDVTAATGWSEDDTLLFFRNEEDAELERNPIAVLSRFAA